MCYGFASMKNALALLLFAAAVSANEPKHGVFANEKLTVGGKERLYRLVVPDSVDLSKPAPLVFAFHGFGIDSKDMMPVYTQLDALAKKEKFILVYPQGLNNAWWIIVEKNPDLPYFDVLLAKLTTDYKIDPKRIYATGMSNGAYFCNILASQRSDKIAAIAPHSGGLGLLAARGINAKQKYAVFIIHGADDKLVKVEEGSKAHDVYKKAGHTVEYLEVAGLGHFWAHKADVNAKIWEFFKGHPIK